MLVLINPGGLEIYSVELLQDLDHEFIAKDEESVRRTLLSHELDSESLFKKDHEDTIAGIQQERDSGNCHNI